MYTGCTSDLKKRFKEHNDGKKGYTKAHIPYDLIYYESCLNKHDAFAREKYLKSGMGKRYLKNRLKLYIEERSLTG
jgi:putative endonuclease